MLYGYARASTESPSIDSQLTQLESAGCEQIFAETVDETKGDRVELGKLLKTVGQGDTVLIPRLDCLARSTQDLLNILSRLAEKGASFRSLNEAWADTTTPEGSRMLTVLTGLAEFEREVIRSRSQEGRAKAKARGQSLGRRPKLTPDQIAEVRARKAAGEPVRQIARSYNVSAATISRI